MPTRNLNQHVVSKMQWNFYSKLIFFSFFLEKSPRAGSARFKTQWIMGPLLYPTSLNKAFVFGTGFMLSIKAFPFRQIYIYLNPKLVTCLYESSILILPFFFIFLSKPIQKKKVKMLTVLLLLEFVAAIDCLY